jgi:hypothetical protein
MAALLSGNHARHCELLFMDFAILFAKTDSIPPHKMEFCGQILHEKVAKPFRAGSCQRYSLTF